jgi:hypothetical protein
MSGRRHAVTVRGHAGDELDFADWPSYLEWRGGLASDPALMTTWARHSVSIRRRKLPPDTTPTDDRRDWPAAGRRLIARLTPFLEYIAMPAASTCSICRTGKPTIRPAGDQSAYCDGCARGHLVPALVKALGAEEVQRLVGAVAAGEASRSGDKVNKLIAGQARPAMQFSRGTGRPATPARRRPTVAEQRLAVGRAAAKAAGQVFEGDIPALVRKAGLNAGGTTAAELSNAAAAVVPAKKPAAPAKKPAAARFTVEQQRTIVARAEARSAGQMFAGDIPALVAKAGLPTASSTAAELSTAVASGAGTTVAAAKPAGTGKATSAPVKRLPANRQPTRSEILERVRRAGFVA